MPASLLPDLNIADPNVAVNFLLIFLTIDDVGTWKHAARLKPG
jgi:hypothetical protein